MAIFVQTRLTFRNMTSQLTIKYLSACAFSMEPRPGHDPRTNDYKSLILPIKLSGHIVGFLTGSPTKPLHKTALIGAVTLHEQLYPIIALLVMTLRLVSHT